MLDLSNNNGAVDFHRIYQAGHRRVYLKRSEGTSFTDRLFPGFRSAAHAAGLKTGAYHFTHPLSHTPSEELAFFLRLLPPLDNKHDLRPCFDQEYGAPSERKGQWITELHKLFREGFGYWPVLYSYPYYLETLRLRAPVGPLWLASFGRNDGKEHPFSVVPPYKTVAAHQYSSNARVAGVSGLVDISHVFSGAALAIPKSA
jgi:lysozyme